MFPYITVNHSAYQASDLHEVIYMIGLILIIILLTIFVAGYFLMDRIDLFFHDNCQPKKGKDKQKKIKWPDSGC